MCQQCLDDPVGGPALKELCAILIQAGKAGEAALWQALARWQELDGDPQETEFRGETRAIMARMDAAARAYLPINERYHQEHER